MVSSPGWDRVQETYFSWDKAVSSFPAVLEGLWLNIRVMAICWVLILVLSLTVADRAHAPRARSRSRCASSARRTSTCSAACRCCW